MGESHSHSSARSTLGEHLLAFYVNNKRRNWYLRSPGPVHKVVPTCLAHREQISQTSTMALKVPESVLKKQATQAKIAEEAKQASYEAKQKKRQDKKDAIASAEKYAAEYKAAEEAATTNRREAKAQGGFFVPAMPKLVLIIRIRGIIGVSPKAKKIMQLFRLRQIHNATFVKLNESTIRMLRLIEPYVTYGYPSRSTVEKLIYKRGFGKLNKQRIPIADNSVIEEGVGSVGVKCCADLIHEIYTVGPHFKEANNFLWPFKLTSPRGGFSNKTKLVHFLEGGEAGNRGEEINKLVKRMI